MPCQSYDTDWGDSSSKLKKECDKLARIACKAMTVLEENGHEDLLLLKDDEVRTWWLKHKEDDRKAKAAEAEKERRARVKQEALDRLSDEEKELLGLARPKKSGSKRKSSWDDEYEEKEWFEESEEEDYEVEYHKTTDGLMVKTIKIR